MYTSKERQHSFLLFTSMILILSTMVGCGPSTAELEAVDYTPLPGDDWKVSTPAEQGLDPMLVAELYLNAAELETLYGLLVIKNGHLIAEGYFNGGSVEQENFLASATKSFTSASVGIALEQGCLSSVDQKMMDFFPELRPLNDSRKEEITITSPDSALINDAMRIVFTIKGRIKRIETNAFAFSSISLCLLDLTDHSIIHCASLP